LINKKELSGIEFFNKAVMRNGNAPVFAPADEPYIPEIFVTVVNRRLLESKPIGLKGYAVQFFA